MLTRYDNDGTAGLASIKAHGGLTMVQDLRAMSRLQNYHWRVVALIDAREASTAKCGSYKPRQPKAA